jgi:hypothetical protein
MPHQPVATFQRAITLLPLWEKLSAEGTDEGSTDSEAGS